MITVYVVLSEDKLLHCVNVEGVYYEEEHANNFVSISRALYGDTKDYWYQEAEII